MTNDTNGIDDTALDSLSVAPDGKESDGHPGRGDAGRDGGITDRLGDADDVDARLDRGLDESMDASDPPSVTQPDRSTDPAPSSGFDADAEARRTQGE
ncbi:hypothetical protein [Sphingomonas sp. CFBP 13720]|uniref:hypothetical protein n=1 Tax=Sphingomonas sp. CFBP 13720 TaxID=2775302 RepID=UPI00177E6D10|nr:hypothetical protein [Sphingomonas sp. CFBP 13720]MBD8677689.1 hypothetical protein [Sphingomonas sp. CFBP 13720]